MSYLYYVDDRSQSHIAKSLQVKDLYVLSLGKFTGNCSQHRSRNHINLRRDNEGRYVENLGRGRRARGYKALAAIDLVLLSTHMQAFYKAQCKRD